MLEKYKAYYATRAKRYEDNPHYQHSYQAEKALSDKIQSLNSFEESGGEIKNLSDNCAFALIKDEAILELNHLEKHQEVIRMKKSQQILDRLDSFDNIVDLMTFITEVSNENSVEVSLDEAHREYFFDQLDHILSYLRLTKVEVPDEYKPFIKRMIDSLIEEQIDGVKSFEETMHPWNENWKLNPDICFEYRHIRHSIYDVELVKELREVYRTLVNR